MFDAVVISGEVGLRKPEPEIFVLALERIGLPAGECAFVDDLPHNVAAAARQGLVGIVHRTFEETAGELEVLFPGAAWVHQR
jgi:putative hydrolase of the HAD superfamily